MADKIQSDLHFAIVPRWIVRHPDLTAQAVRLYAALADHADKEGRSFPARSTLAAECGGMTRKTVDRALALLIEQKAVTVTRRHGAVSTYTVHKSPPEGVVSRVSQGVDTGVAGSVDTDVSQKKTHSEVDPLSTRVSSEEYQKVYAEFVVLFGTPTGDMRGRYGKAAKAAVAAGIDSGQLGPAKRRYQEVWPSVSCGPQALVNNWNRFGPRKARIVVEEPEDIVEPADPALVRSLVEGFRG